MTLLFLILILGRNVALASGISDANESINQSYPKTRYATSIYSVLFGAMAIWKGSDELNRDKPASHDTLGTISVLVGLTRMTDGTIGLFRPNEAEKLARDHKIQDQETLERLARNGMYTRIMRSSLIAINSVTFLSLYNKKDPEYKPLIFPGVIMGIISIANLINKSPEEKALKKMNNSDYTFDFVPKKEGGMAIISWNF